MDHVSRTDIRFRLPSSMHAFVLERLHEERQCAAVRFPASFGVLEIIVLQIRFQTIPAEHGPRPLAQHSGIACRNARSLRTVSKS